MSRKLNEIRFSKLKKDALIGIFGEPGFGKTSCAKQIIWHNRHKFPVLLVSSGNEATMAGWEEMTHPMYIHNDTKQLEKLIDANAAKIAKDKRKWMAAGNSESSYVVPYRLRFGVVLDDHGSNKSLMNSPLMKRILTTNRHLGLFVVLICQYIHQLEKDSKHQLSDIALFQLNDDDNNAYIHKKYLGTTLCSPKFFRKTLHHFTKEGKGHLMWISKEDEKGSRMNELESRLFWKILEYPFHLPKANKIFPEAWAQGEKHFYDRNAPRPRKNSEDDQDPWEAKAQFIQSSLPDRLGLMWNDDAPLQENMRHLPPELPEFSVHQGKRQPTIHVQPVYAFTHKTKKD